MPIDITNADLKKFVKTAYALSKPQGLGFINAKEGELSDKDADEILLHGDDWRVFSMDYVHGRSIKMHAHRKDGKIIINDSWYDHSDNQLEELLAAVGIDWQRKEEAA